MSPGLHRPHLAETRHAAGFGGPAPTPPPAPPCDTCAGPVSRYNRLGRCNPCCHHIGFPEDPVDVVPKQRQIPKGHTDTCECFTRREPILDDNGNHRRKTKHGGSPLYTIRVTCPDCHEDRDVQYGGSTTSFLCRTRYRLPCMSCSRLKSRSAGKKQAPEYRIAA